MRYIAIVILTFCQILLFSSSALLAATMTPEGDSAIALSGPIAAGDSEALQKILLNDPEHFIAFSTIYLNSNGGNVEEAIQIAKILDKFKLAAVVREGDICTSACFAIYAAAPSRFSNGKLVIHRPFYRPSVHKDASIEYMQSLQKEAITNLSAFLADKFVPDYLIDHLVKTPSNSAYTLTKEDRDNLGYFLPPWEELLIAGRCQSAPKLGGSNKLRIEALSKCSVTAGQTSRYEYLRRNVSPEIASEALRAHLLSIGATEMHSGRMAIEPESKPAHEKDKISTTQPDPMQEKEDSAAKDEKRPETDLEYLDRFSLEQLQSGRLRALEAADNSAVQRFDRLIAQKKERHEVEQIWNMFSARAEEKGIDFEDPGRHEERLIKLLTEILPKLSLRGDSDAAYRLAVSYYQLNEIQTAIGHAKAAAELGSGDALMFLGMIYQTETSETRDLPRALAYYNLAFKRGDTRIRESWVKQRRDELQTELSEGELEYSSQLKALIESTLPAQN